MEPVLDMHTIDIKKNSLNLISKHCINPMNGIKANF